MDWGSKVKAQECMPQFPTKNFSRMIAPEQTGDFRAMCGFSGAIGQGLDEALLARSLPVLLRRGPDSHSHWIEPGRRAGLTHTRLAIVDPDARANQPFTSQDGQIALAFNGEIYNYRALRATLKEYAFRTESDTEVILALYLSHGATALRRLEGMFSMAIVDLRQQLLILFRDAVGKKPLFVAHMAQGNEFQITFGSGVSAILAMQAHRFGRSATLRAEALNEYWPHGHMPANQSAFEGVRPLLPGQLLSYGIQDGKCVGDVQLQPDPSECYNGENPQDCSKRIGELLEQAVALRLDEQPRATVLLSGGIDSTVVTQIAHRQAQVRGIPLHALSVAAWLPMSNDEYYARYAGKRAKIPLTILKLPHNDLAKRVSAMLDLQDEPLGFISYFLLAQLVNEAAKHSKILLTGDGGDEVFFGYGQPKDWRSLGNDLPAGAIRVGPDLPPWVSTWGRGMAGGELLGHGFAKADRASAEQGVELRCPLLDWRLMSYVRSLPYDRLFPRDSAKSLLKSQLSDWPDWFVERKKAGFTYNLRWQWGMRGFAGLRECFEGGLAESLKARMPAALRAHPSQWSTYAIFSNFTTVWKALAWQRFLLRNA